MYGVVNSDVSLVFIFVLFCPDDLSFRESGVSKSHDILFFNPGVYLLMGKN